MRFSHADRKTIGHLSWGRRFMRKKHSSLAHGHPDRGPWDWSVERLESRCLLAGNVIGTVVGSTLRLVGDAANNDVVLSSPAGTLMLATGADTTNISVNGSLDGVKRIIWDTGGGADKICLEQLDLAGSLSIRGSGSQTVSIAGTTIGGSLLIESGAALHINMTDSDIGGRTRWTHQEGTAEIVIGSGSFLRGPVDLRLAGSGEKYLSLVDATLERGLSFRSEAGSVTTVLAGQTEVWRRWTSTVTSGSDDFEMRDESLIVGTLARSSNGPASRFVMRDAAEVTSLVRQKSTGGTADVRIIDDAEVGRFIGSGVTTRKNVVYANRATGDLKADIYTPKTDGPHPAILVIHGGYWRFGSKSAMSQRSRQLADRGYVVVNIDYRLAPNSQFPDQIHDVKSAVIWMRENAQPLQIDPDRIGTYGYSAGGHLALLLGMTDGSEGLEGPDATGVTSTRVQAVVAGGPAVDFRDFAPSDDQLAYFLGGTRDEVPDNYANASPANWVSSDDPPTMIFIGENDALVNRPKIDAFMDSLESAGVENRFHEVAGKNHLQALADADALLASARFFDEILKAV